MGLFKDEIDRKIMKEVVGLRANIYSYLIDNGVRIDIRKCSTKNV